MVIVKTILVTMLTLLTAAPAMADMCPIVVGDHPSYHVGYKVERLAKKPDVPSIAYQGGLAVTSGQPNASQVVNMERKGYTKSPKERAEIETGMTLTLSVVPGKSGDADGLSYDFTSFDLVSMKQVAGQGGMLESPQTISRKVSGMSNVDFERPIILELPASSSEAALKVSLDVKLCSTP